MHNLFRRISRFIFYQATKPLQSTPWRLLHYYPHNVPSDEILQQWQQSEWDEYQQWIDTHGVPSANQWLKLHKQALFRKSFPHISIITPVFNTEAEMLKTCILSVRLQTSPFWELILIDDGSSKQETGQILSSSMCHDPRIHILPPETNKPYGISAATNRGIEYATGDYILFLDHDDRLAPEALQSIADELIIDPSLDILYSDRDMISLKNKRFMHLMKPDWSPETLYSANYIFHLMCYRKKLVQSIGGLRSAFDGGQDHDLILRCMEHTQNIKHIPKVLYHYREHAQSIALNEQAKSYAYNAGIKAIEEALKRRGVQQAKVQENPTTWRGNYQVHLQPAAADTVGIIKIDRNSSPDEYAQNIKNHPVIKKGAQPYILFQHDDYKKGNEQPVEIMASWLHLESIAMVSGRLLDQNGKIAYAGITYGQNGEIVFPYCGYPAEEPGYMAVTKNLRNISGPDPYSVMIRRELWEQLIGFDQHYHGPHALLDLALKALETGWRIIYNPLAQFTSSTNSLKTAFTEQDTIYFKKKWSHWFHQGDPYYNPNLSKTNGYYKLKYKPDI